MTTASTLPLGEPIRGVDLGHTVPEPDVLVVSRAAVKSDSLVFQPADVHLAIEVVSPGTTTKDRTLRPAQYAGAGRASSTAG